MAEPLNPHDRDEARRREALDALEKLRRDRAPLAGSGLADAARRAARHFAAADAVGPDGARDPIELWGRRVGRALSLLAVVALAIYLYLTYLR
ncbi:MAG TPA: hypothetical protein VK456_07340 [Xanthobacteraceae bacterium]|nr:hypothetical protein [Xanthobacteraceae bacterium]